MNDKIALFQEILAGDPTSKLFYPLAKLYLEQGQPERAVDTLRQGLSRHPDHMEARLTLIDALAALGRETEARGESGAVAEMLAAHPVFWRLWSARAGQESADCALAIEFLAAHLAGRCPTFLGLLSAGMSGGGAASESRDAAPAPSDARRQVDPARPAGEIKRALAEEAGDLDESPDEEANLRTRTMADLLYSQEDYSGALEIYEELMAAAGPIELQELTARAAEARARLGRTEALATPAEGRADEASGTSTAPLVSTLSALAERLEARAKSRASRESA